MTTMPTRGARVARPTALAPFDTLFDELIGATRAAASFAVDVEQDADGFTVTAELPGVPAGEVSVSFDDGRLTIERTPTERTPEDAAERGGGTVNLVTERRQLGQARRHLDLGHRVDAGRIDATLRDGVLRVRAPFQETAKAKTITVKTR
jgi:HSP20 family protein